MRDKLNNSPAAQVGVVLVLVAVAVVMFLNMSSSGESEESSSGEVAASVNGAVATGATPGEAVENAVGTLEAEAGAVASSAATQIPSSLPVPPLPAPVRGAYRSGETVVLLVVHDGGIDDRLVARSTRRLAAYPHTAVFVVPAHEVARYSAITLGVALDQVPALVVVRPRRLNHGIPRATVTYGFQTQAAIAQAMRDASYHGPEATYHPG